MRRAAGQTYHEIKETFDKLGIPAAEREYLGGVGAQYDSRLCIAGSKGLISQTRGDIRKIMDVQKNTPNLYRKYFMK